jgi:hypothetical protein
MLASKALAAAVSQETAYIEDVFSTWLYTGNGSTQTITNGIDLAGEGGLTWIKSRSAATDNQLFDTARGATKELISNSTAAETTDSDTLTAFNSNGFALGADSNTNTNAATYVSWTFRKQPKFFDVVTYTGNGVAGRTIAHNLGSAPGCVIVKSTDTTEEWKVYHRSVGNTASLTLNTTAAALTNDTWNNTTPTDSVISLGSTLAVNTNAINYVAYIFAHDAGGFGLTGTDNVISCGTFTTDGSGNATVNLGYEPQWIMAKASGTSENWLLLDNMRGLPVDGTEAILHPNNSNAEASSTNFLYSRATGFIAGSSSGGSNLSVSTSYIYIAIRRGPMKVPTSGTSVYNALTNTGNGASVRSFTGVGFPPDSVLPLTRGATGAKMWGDRLRGSPRLQPTDTSVESSGFVKSYDQDGWTTASDAFGNSNTLSFVSYAFKRAPSFFDVVCYTGTGVARTVAHNLGVVPELMIVKKRSAADAWAVYANNDNTDYLVLNTTAATVDDNTIWNDTSPTASVFTVGTNDDVNGNTATFVTYLFATLAGVSKVGSYTGNGSSQTINCGFTAGARFVLVKATSTTGNWIVADSARGIVAGNDPALYLNSTAAEVTGLDWIDADSSGFVVNETATIAANTNGVSYIFVAVA